MEKEQNQNRQDLIREVKFNVENFLADRNNLFFNECDLQMYLAIWLKETKKYDGIDVEYYVPKNINLEKIINGIVNYTLTLSLNKGKHIVLLN